jgi:hypothetical protein
MTLVWIWSISIYRPTPVSLLLPFLHLSLAHFLPAAANAVCPTLTSPDLPPRATFEIQLASQHARLLYPPAPGAKLPRSEDVEAIKLALDNLGPSCIACWLHQTHPAHDHRLQECIYHPNPYTTHNAQWKLWRGSLKFPKTGVCYGCGCLQHVSLSPIVGSPYVYLF